ncbi:hypothetical protein ACHAWF_003585 [Thalassiosira exigua]
MISFGSSRFAARARIAAATPLLLLAGNLGQVQTAAATEACAALDNAQCNPLDHEACGGTTCSGFLECELTTFRCATVPRGYGQPCKLRRCGAGLRCSVACGVCVDEAEEDLVSLPSSAAEAEDDSAASRDDVASASGGGRVATACGMSSTRVFRNWIGNVRTDHPLLAPEDDEALWSILEKARQGGCKVRPAGSGHSAPGVVAEESSEGDVVVVSLARYAASDADWATIALLNEGTQAPSVIVPAGMTQLELYAEIRPHGYFLETQTATFGFAMGGIVSNFVHGGAFGKGPIHDSVLKMRVMLWDGTVEVISDTDVLKYWRNGFGLLGFITAVELAVVRRPNFWFGTFTTQAPEGGWDSANFQAYIDGVKAEYTGAQFFMNPHDREILAVVQKDRDEPEAPAISDGDCKWSFGGVQCKPADLCSRQYRFGDWTLSQSCRSIARPVPATDEECLLSHNPTRNLSEACLSPDRCSLQPQLGDVSLDIGQFLDDVCRLRVPEPPDANTMTEAYEELLLENPLLGVDGTLVGDDRFQQAAYCLASRIGLQEPLVGLVMTTIPTLVRDAYLSTNDGFYNAESAPIPAPYLGYLIPAPELYGVLEEVARLDYVLTGPVEWRFVTIGNDTAVLQPGDPEPGEYAAIEALSLEIPGWTPADWRKQFRDVEAILKNAGGFPHTGKWFGMGEDDKGVIQPFQNVGAGDIFSSAQKQDFQAYAGTVDPLGLFWSGSMADYVFGVGESSLLDKVTSSEVEDSSEP